MVEPVTIDIRFLARDLGLPSEQVEKIVALLDEGCPVPFIARFRKDQTDNPGEEKIRLVDERLRAMRALCERKQAILKTIDSAGKWTPELDKKIRDARSPRRLEDLYRPFKPKKQTLGFQARQRGLEPLAQEILDGKLDPETLDKRAAEFIDDDKKVVSVADALLGAGHIIAETFAEMPELLQKVREFVHRNGKVVSTKVETKTAEAKTTADPAATKTAAKREINRDADKNKVDGDAEKDKKAVVEVEAADTTDRTTDITAAAETAAAAVDPPATSSESEPLESDSETPKISSDAPESVESDPHGEDSSGSGGGEEEGEKVDESPHAEPTDTEPTDTSSESVVSEPAAPESPSLPDSANADIPAASTAETSATEATSDVSSDEVRELTEQFQQLKEALQEQGMPTVQSQNTLKKKKREESKKKKAEIKIRQREQLEKQFADYFDFSSGLRNMPAYRILTIHRGEKAKIIRAKIQCDERQLFEQVRERCVRPEHPLADFLNGCLNDSLHRIVLPSMEREIREEWIDSAETHSIRVFAENLHHLLLQPPLDRKRVLVLDPGVRNGCRAVSLDEFGNILGHLTVFLVGSAERKEKAIDKIADLARTAKADVIAVGAGPGSREAEECISAMIAKHFADSNLAYLVVNESAANAYSTGALAKEELPNYDTLLRRAVSIGRRLQNPLNELVKVEPTHLGVGMYQHDVKGKMLQDALTRTVESCVNRVGVDVNAATASMLRYVAGLNPVLARRIVDYRRENGPFRCREDLKKVTGLNETVFTQAAGFLRIPGGSNPLDSTWIHPENYPLATAVMEKLGFAVGDLRSPDKIGEIAATIREGKVTVLTARYAEELNAGSHTIRDILDNFSKPGRDPRDLLPKPIFRKGVLRIGDLTPGMELTGTVLNVVDFGAFIDIGLHESGLVHISHMADRFVKDAHDKVAVGDVLKVWVVEADPVRKRISLTMLPPGTERQAKPEGRRDESPREPRQDRPKRNDRKDGQDSRGGDRRRDGDRGGDRERGRGRDHRDRGGRDRGSKTYVAPPKEKTLKPISEDMKKGKEPLRSFGDLAQLLGRVQVQDPAEEKKRKKEEDRLRRENEKKGERKATPVSETPDSVEKEPESTANGSS